MKEKREIQRGIKFISWLPSAYPFVYSISFLDSFINDFSLFYTLFILSSFFAINYSSSFWILVIVLLKYKLGLTVGNYIKKGKTWVVREKKKKIQKSLVLCNVIILMSVGVDKAGVRMRVEGYLNRTISRRQHNIVASAT